MNEGSKAKEREKRKERTRVAALYIWGAAVYVGTPRLGYWCVGICDAVYAVQLWLVY